MFDFISYIKKIFNENALAKKENFQFGTCSGINALQGAVTKIKTADAFFIADTVTTGGTVKKGPAWYQRRTFTFFILKKVKFGDEENREKTLDLCRELRRQMLSRILHDQQLVLAGSSGAAHISFDLESVASTEYSDMQLSNCCGLYAMINSDEPISLMYEEREWNQG